MGDLNNMLFGESMEATSSMRGAGEEASKPENQVYDPFAGERAGYQTQMAALSADPSSISKTPGYEAGLQAVTRKLASQGFLGSGNMMASLQQFGGQFFNQEMQRLMQLSGANSAPTRTDSSGKLTGVVEGEKTRKGTQDSFLSGVGSVFSSVFGGGPGKGK